MAITIYGIKNCDTMKKARAWLDGQGVAYDFHDYKTAGIDSDQLKRWAKNSAGKPAQSRRHHVQKLPDRTRKAQREEGAGADAGAALDDQAPGARPRRQIAGRLQAGDLREGSAAKARDQQDII